MKKELLILLINKWWISMEPDTSFTPVTLPREITEDMGLSLFMKFFLEREKEREKEQELECAREREREREGRRERGKEEGYVSFKVEILNCRLALK